ncbi:MAG: 3-deoxy-7-phosphoheptulonate synthase [Opitutales bacterium]|nr:3-deoxy-7-phosphoheptulonate synthase [Opitutales bacterium]NRA26787.1 3-deoxy-7-phosphoheptulonate synthase [Opitutales bacterium]
MNPSKTSINNLNIESYENLVSISEIRKSIPSTDDAERTIAKGREALFRILDGDDDRFVVVVGPCSIHDPKAALEYAQAIQGFRKRFGDRIEIIMRVYFEKPRTSIGWKGLINDPHLDGSYDMNNGLKLCRSLLIEINEMGVPAGTELLDPVIAAYIGELVSWVSIGARTTESQTHRQMASGLSAPVGLKNGTDGSLDSPMNAMISSGSPHAFLSINDAGEASIVRTRGNDKTHIILRGAKGASGYEPNYSMQHVETVEARLESLGFKPQLMVDCSHANSRYDHTCQRTVLEDVIQQKTNGNRSIFGVMIESNINEGKQKLAGPLDSLKYGVSVTDACVNLQETEALLAHIYDARSDMSV